VKSDFTTEDTESTEERKEGRKEERKEERKKIERRGIAGLEGKSPPFPPEAGEGWGTCDLSTRCSLPRRGLGDACCMEARRIPSLGKDLR
jgi:hypothetical protein